MQQPENPQPDTGINQITKPPAVVALRPTDPVYVGPAVAPVPAPAPAPVLAAGQDPLRSTTPQHQQRLRQTPKGPPQHPPTSPRNFGYPAVPSRSKGHTADHDRSPVPFTISGPRATDVAPDPWRSPRGDAVRPGEIRTIVFDVAPGSSRDRGKSVDADADAAPTRVDPESYARVGWGRRLGSIRDGRGAGIGGKGPMLLPGDGEHYGGYHGAGTDMCALCLMDRSVCPCRGDMGWGEGRGAGPFADIGYPDNVNLGSGVDNWEKIRRGPNSLDTLGIMGFYW